MTRLHSFQIRHAIAALMLAITAAGCTVESTTGIDDSATSQPAAPHSAHHADNTMNPTDASGQQVATFGAGCYWCIEAILEQQEGVQAVTSGFMGGHIQNPSYEAVCSGTTGHAEVVHVQFDPSKISYQQLLYWFFKSHDPTTLNRQGADVGTQYRSAIFYHNAEQKELAEATIAKLTDETVYASPIVTEVTEASTFYEAKQEHQDFYRNNRAHGYCRAVIAPKLDKLGLQK